MEHTITFQASEAESEENNSPELERKKTKEELASDSLEWGSSLENILQKIKEKCLYQKKVNLLASKKETIKYNFLMYFLMFLGTASGILTSISDSYFINPIVISFSFLSSMISASVRFSKFNQKAAQFKSFGARFDSLKENIDRQLQLPKEERIVASEYLNWVSHAYDELYAAMPISVSTLGKELEEEKKEKEEKKEQENTSKINLKSPSVMKSAEEKIDLNHFSDSRMQYELSRLHQFSKKN